MFNTTHIHKFYIYFQDHLPFVNVARLIFFQLHILFKWGHIGFVQSVFNKLFVCVSTYDLFRASLASISVVKWIILQLAILKLVAIAVFLSYPKSPLSSVAFWTPWTSILLQFSENFRAWWTTYTDYSVSSCITACKNTRTCYIIILI